MSNFARLNKDALRTDITKMQQGELGPSQAQMNQATAQAMGQARQTVGAMQTLNARSGLDPRAMAQARTAATGAVAQAGAGAAMQVEQMRQAVMEARRAEIIARMNQMHDRRRENIQTGIQAGLKGAEIAGNAATGFASAGLLGKSGG